MRSLGEGIQRLQCLEQAEAVPAAGAGRARAVLLCAASSTGTGTGACRANTDTRQAGLGRFRTVLSCTVLVPARLNWPVWPSVVLEWQQNKFSTLLIDIYIKFIIDAWNICTLSLYEI